MQTPFEENDINVYVKKLKSISAYDTLQHFQMEIIYVVSGKVQMTVNNITKTLSAGDVGVIFPYSTHSAKKSDDLEAIVLFFDPTIVDSFQKKLFSSRPVNPYIKKAQSIYFLFEKIVMYSEKKKDEYKKMANIYLLALVGEIIQLLKFVDIERSSVNTVQKILNYCSEHYAEDITMKDASKALNISQSSITKIFSNKLNTSFREYLNRLRVNKAKYFLERTDKKIIHIMRECGFKNQSTFNRVFLDMCGVVPSELRKNIKD